MVEGNPELDAGDEVAGSIHDRGLGLDCALEEGEEDVGDGLDGSSHDGVAAAVDAGAEGEGAGLALGDVGGAEEVGGRSQQLVTVVGAGGVRGERRSCGWLG